MRYVWEYADAVVHVSVMRGRWDIEGICNLCFDIYKVCVA